MGPSGTIIAQCEASTDFVLVNINLNQADSTRLAMPVYNHRRYDIYPKILPATNYIGEGQKKYQFGQVEVFAESVFYRSALTIAFTNKRCVVPGRILSPVKHL